MRPQSNIINAVYIITNILVMYNWLIIIILLLFGERGIREYIFLAIFLLPAELIIRSAEYSFLFYHLLVDAVLAGIILHKAKLHRSSRWDDLLLYTIKVKYIALVLVVILFLGLLLIIVSGDGPLIRYL